MQEKWTVIITGGYAPCRETIRAYTDNAEFIVAADSGFDIAYAHNIGVDFVVGDMDSIKNRSVLSGIPDYKKLIVSHEKDETDTELALDKAWNEGYRKIILIGGGGGRLDHIIGILCLFEREKSPKIWVTDNEAVFSVEGDIHIKTTIGERISLFPLGNQLHSLYSEGLKWNLNGLSWKRGDIGISNEATDTAVRISVKGGKLLMIRENKPGIAYV